MKVDRLVETVGWGIEFSSFLSWAEGREGGGREE